MIINTINKTLFTFILCCLVTLGYAQQPDLPGGEVEVIRDFEARLLDTEKLSVQPSLPPLDTTTIRQNYNVQPLTITVNYLPPKIRPIAMKSNKLEEGYNGYAKLGVGFPKSFFADISYNIFAQKQFDVGLDFKHYSANNSKNIENQRFMHNSAGLQGTYYLSGGYAVKGKARYSVDDYYLYGYTSEENPNPPIDEIPPEDVLQQFNTVRAGVDFFNAERNENDINYHAGLDFYFRSDGDLDVARERGLDLNIGGTKWIAGQHPLSVTLRTDFTNFKVNEESDLNNFFLQPNFTYHAEAFKVKLGLNLASHNDEYYFFPDAELSANVLPSILTAFVGAEGDLYKNNFLNLSDYNPYVQTRIRLRNTDYLNFYGGVKGVYAGIEYRAKAGYKRANNLALFLTDEDDINRFQVLYDSVNIITVGGTITSPNFKGFDLTATVNFNNYTTTEQEEAWHLPAVEVNLLAKYKTLEDKLRIKGQLFIENGVPFIDVNGDPGNLNGLLDISLGAEYLFSNNFGAFVDVNNLASVNRQRWYNYPSLGINVLGGITAKF